MQQARSRLRATLIVLLIGATAIWAFPVYRVGALDPACISDQPFREYSFSSADPRLILDPGEAAAQSFRPSLNTLCLLTVELWADANDLGRRFVFDVTLRESLDGPPVASRHVDTYPSSQTFGPWEPFASVEPEREYFAVVEVGAGSQPLLWYWMTPSYDRGSAWVRANSTWQAQGGQDLLFFSSGFNDVSAFPLPDPSWTEEEWQSNNWKTYPAVATWLDLDLDGTADVETFNNSYWNGTPVSTDGNVRLEDLNRTEMLPLNLSIALEFVSHANSPENRSSLRIVVDRLPGAPGNQSASDPAWILVDGTEFLPLLFAPPGTGLDVLDLEWNSTLEENAFGVYTKERPEDNTTEVWIYIGHFSTQSITIRGPAAPRLPPSPNQDPALAIVASIAVAGVAAAILALRLTRRRGRA